MRLKMVVGLYGIIIPIRPVWLVIYNGGNENDL